MSAKPDRNKFAAALKPAAAAPEPREEPRGSSDAAVAERPTLKHPRPSRAGTKMIGGYFDPAVSKQLRLIAVQEDSTVQDLVAEALDLLFQSRRKPTIARQQKEA